MVLLCADPGFLGKTSKLDVHVIAGQLQTNAQVTSQTRKSTRATVKFAGKLVAPLSLTSLTSSRLHLNLLGPRPKYLTHLICSPLLSNFQQPGTVTCEPCHIATVTKSRLPLNLRCHLDQWLSCSNRSARARSLTSGLPDVLGILLTPSL